MLNSYVKFKKVFKNFNKSFDLDDYILRDFHFAYRYVVNRFSIYDDDIDFLSNFGLIFYQLYFKEKLIVDIEENKKYIEVFVKLVLDELYEAKISPYLFFYVFSVYLINLVLKDSIVSTSLYKFLKSGGSKIL